MLGKLFIGGAMMKQMNDDSSLNGRQWTLAKIRIAAIAAYSLLRKAADHSKREEEDGPQYTAQCESLFQYTHLKQH